MKKRHNAGQIIRILGGERAPRAEDQRRVPTPGDQRASLLPLAQEVEVSEASIVEEMETENSGLKKLVANQALDIQILKEVTQTNG